MQLQGYVKSLEHLSRTVLFQHLVEHNQGILIAHDSVHLQYLVLELWKELCIRNYPLVTEQYPEEDCEEPESWREAYFVRRLFAILNYK